MTDNYYAITIDMIQIVNIIISVNFSILSGNLDTWPTNTMCILC